jgi:hypothetical protein
MGHSAGVFAVAAAPIPTAGERSRIRQIRVICVRYPQPCRQEGIHRPGSAPRRAAPPQDAAVPSSGRPSQRCLRGRLAPVASGALPARAALIAVPIVAAARGAEPPLTSVQPVAPDAPDFRSRFVARSPPRRGDSLAMRSLAAAGSARSRAPEAGDGRRRRWLLAAGKRRAPGTLTGPPGCSAPVSDPRPEPRRHRLVLRFRTSSCTRRTVGTRAWMDPLRTRESASCQARVNGPRLLDRGGLGLGGLV